MSDTNSSFLHSKVFVFDFDEFLLIPSRRRVLFMKKYVSTFHTTYFDLIKFSQMFMQRKRLIQVSSLSITMIFTFTARIITLYYNE